MKLLSTRLPAFAGSHRDEDGLVATARVSRDTAELIKRIKPGEIAVIDELDLDRSTAELLVEKDVAGVINASTFISGRYPNLGPEVLALHDVRLIENVGVTVFRRIKDGAKIRMVGSEVFQGKKPILGGHELDEEEVAERIVAAKSGISDHLEAFASNATEFIRSEAPLLIDGVGVPEVDVPLNGKHVVVVTDNPQSIADLRKIKNYIREYRPIMMGVNAGADFIIREGYELDVAVGEPETMASATLQSAKSVIISADPDGRAKGLPRIQDLGIGAMTFPARGEANDLALILADYHGAELIITVGDQASFEDFFDNQRAASNPSHFLTRLKMTHKLVDAKAVAHLYRSEVSVWQVMLTLIAIVGIIVAVLAVAGVLAPAQHWLGEQISNYIPHQ